MVFTVVGIVTAAPAKVDTVCANAADIVLCRC